MRITNQMVTGNSLRNMQKSMSAVNKTTEQMTSGKKISQASDDPVIAIRALKLRTTVNQLEQYKGKNIPDANSWLEITTTSLDNITSRLTDIQTYCVQGSTDSFNSTNRGAIIDSLKQLQSMLYAEGNSTYAGRYIFSGYKTDRSLAFTETEDTSIYSYDITQHFDSTALDMKQVVLDGVDYTQLDTYMNEIKNNLTSTYSQPNPEQVYRLNLAYEGISDVGSDGNTSLAIKATDAAGNAIDLSGFTVTVMETTDSKDYYRVGADDIHVIKETGEIIMGENAYNTIKTADDIAVTYSKNKFESGDLRPEHYFDCTQHVVQSDGTVKDVDYTETEGGQKIMYEVNFNQSIQVNTEGTELISEEMSNNINDLIYCLNDLQAAEKAQERLKSMLADNQYAKDEDAVKQINRMLEDINIEIAVKRENLQKTFSANITNFQGYMSQVSAVQSDVGSRMTKLEMVKTRVEEQYASFKELKSTNEDAETDETAIAFKEANLVYESALAATGNVMRKTLLDYIQNAGGYAMVAETKFFGTVDIEDDKILTFPMGIIGFENLKKFAIIFDTDREEKSKISWLQSMEEPLMVMPIINPDEIVEDGYHPIVEDELMKQIGDPADVDLLIVVTMSIPSDLTKMTANLKAPIIINTKTCQAMQVIVENEDYIIKYNVYDAIERLKKVGE